MKNKEIILAVKERISDIAVSRFRHLFSLVTCYLGPVGLFTIFSKFVFILINLKDVSRDR